jgi:hypothetical protein
MILELQIRTFGRNIAEKSFKHKDLKNPDAISPEADNIKPEVLVAKTGFMKAPITSTHIISPKKFRKNIREEKCINFSVNGCSPVTLKT